MMKLLKVSLLATTLFTASCVSWVFAKSPFNDMPEGKYELDLAHASVVWKVSHFGLSDYVARFANFDASIDFDPKNIENSVVTATIDPTSIQTAYPNAAEKDFNEILAKDEDWFNAVAFPAIEFASTSIEMTGENTAIMQGSLFFLGTTLPVTMDVILNGAMQRQPFSGKPTMGFSATTTIERSEFGMTKYVPNIGDSVEIMIEGEFAKAE
jgi:polyisoprenoid-binding protein YceI